MTYTNKASYEALPPCRTNEDIHECYLWSTVIKCASFLLVYYTLLITSPSPPAFCKYLKRFEFNTTAISRFEGYWGFGHVRAFICDGNDLRHATSIESPREFVPANDTTLMRFQALNATHMVQLSCDVAQLIWYDESPSQDTRKRISSVLNAHGATHLWCLRNSSLNLIVLNTFSTLHNASHVARHICHSAQRIARYAAHRDPLRNSSKP